MRVISILFVSAACTSAVAPSSTLPVRFDDVDITQGAAPVQRTVLQSADADAPIVDERAPFDTRCSVELDAGSPVALSEDGTRIATVAGGELVVWSARSCERIAAHPAGPTLLAFEFAGWTRDLLVLHDDRIVWIGVNQAAPSTTVPLPGVPTRWAIAPDGKQLALGLRSASTTSLAIWTVDLAGRMRVQREVRLPMVDREIDGLAYARDGRRLVATMPIHGLYRRTELEHAHLAVELDTSSWRQGRRAIIPTADTPITLVAERDAILWDGRAFDWTGEPHANAAYVWDVSSAGSVAAVSTAHGYATWVRGESLPTGGLVTDLDFRTRTTWRLRAIARDRTMLFCTAARCVPVKGP